MTFALVVGLNPCDDYLLLRPENLTNESHRFFTIVTSLPMELQMRICNITADLEQAFRSVPW
jgi:hypothetical protein